MRRNRHVTSENPVNAACLFYFEKKNFDFRCNRWKHVVEKLKKGPRAAANQLDPPPPLCKWATPTICKSGRPPSGIHRSITHGARGREWAVPHTTKDVAADWFHDIGNRRGICFPRLPFLFSSTRSRTHWNEKRRGWPVVVLFVFVFLFHFCERQNKVKT